MALFITSTSAPLRHGVYAVERTPPATIQPTGTGTTALIGQFPWGPATKLYTTASTADFINTYAPPGSSHYGSAYLSATQKGWPVLKVVRVTGTATAVASGTIVTSTPSNLVTITAKYFGALGNSLVGTIQAPSDGVTGHFNLQVQLTGATGTTTDTFQNLNFTALGATLPSFANTLLVGGMTQLIAGQPVIGATITFTGGSDGTVTSTNYVGTQGAADQGVALCEGDLTIDGVVADDPGSALRVAVNTGLAAHADYMTDRVAYLNGDSGLTLAAVQTQKSAFASLRSVWVDVWPYIFDDTTGAKTLVPPAPWAASVAAQLPPSTSIAWKSTIVRALMANIVDLEFDRGAGCITNTAQGICTLIREITGGFTFEAGVVCGAPANPTKRNLTRTRMGHYLARSVVQSLREYVDSPNIPANQQDEVNAVTQFLEGLQSNAGTSAATSPYILGYSIGDLTAFNTASTLANGQFFIPANVQLGSNQEEIFLTLQYGESVNVTTSL